jgi:hypothetical protein
LLNFNEPVNSSSISVDGNARLSGARNGTQFASIYLLSGGTSISPNGRQISINLTTADLNAIKQDTSLATERNTTFLSFSSSLITDMAGVPVNAVPLENGARADSYIDDATRPVLLSYGLNMASEPATITLTFRETVSATSLSLGYMTIQRAFNVSTNASNEQHRLSDGTLLSTTDSTVVRAQLTAYDYASLKLKVLASNPNNTWLIADQDAVLDMSNVGSPAMINGVDALQVNPAAFVYDTTAPRLQHVDINVSQGRLDLYFSEPVESSSFASNGLQFQNSQVAPP